MIIKKQKIKAVTLVETLLYLAIFAMIFTTVVQFFVVLSEFNSGSYAKVKIQDSIIFLDSHLRQNFQDNTAVDYNNSVLNVPNGRLILTNDASEIEYFLQNNVLFVNNNGQNSQLTSNEFRVTSFEVNNIEYDVGNPVGIRVVLRLEFVKDNKIFNTLEGTYVI